MSLRGQPCLQSDMPEGARHTRCARRSDWFPPGAEALSDTTMCVCSMLESIVPFSARVRARYCAGRRYQRHKRRRHADANDDGFHLPTVRAVPQRLPPPPPPPPPWEWSSRSSTTGCLFTIGLVLICLIPLVPVGRDEIGRRTEIGTPYCRPTPLTTLRLRGSSGRH